MDGKCVCVNCEPWKPKYQIKILTPFIHSFVPGLFCLVFYAFTEDTFRSWPNILSYLADVSRRISYVCMFNVWLVSSFRFALALWCYAVCAYLFVFCRFDYIRSDIPVSQCLAFAMAMSGNFVPYAIAHKISFLPQTKKN